MPGLPFCGLRPMRSVNARVICLIGMNEGVFPRHTQKPSFDFPVSEERVIAQQGKMTVIFF